MRWFLQACPACGGDLYEDEEGTGFTCLMCARYYWALDRAARERGAREAAAERLEPQAA